MLIEDGGHADWRRIAPMLLAALPGLVAGLLLLAALSKQALQIAVGLAVILRGRAAALGAAAAGRRSTPSSRGRPACGAGFLSGALTTSISVSGPPIVLWLEAHGIGPSEFRASLAASFFALNLMGWVMLIAIEGNPSVDAGVAVPLLGVVFVGYALGTLAFRRLGSERFFAIALALVLCSGVASLVAGLAAL